MYLIRGNNGDLKEFFNLTRALVLMPLHPFSIVLFLLRVKLMSKH